jgi:S-adenosylmethionine synthetase
VPRIAEFGRIPHYNVDKALLVSGGTKPRCGGADRARCASSSAKPRRCQRACQVAAKAWLQLNLRFVDPERHFVFQSELKEGRPELTDLFVRETGDSGD